MFFKVGEEVVIAVGKHKGRTAVVSEVMNSYKTKIPILYIVDFSSVDKMLVGSSEITKVDSNDEVFNMIEDGV